MRQNRRQGALFYWIGDNDEAPMLDIGGGRRLNGDTQAFHDRVVIYRTV
jgi:hypothetical protein